MALDRVTNPNAKLMRRLDGGGDTKAERAAVLDEVNRLLAESSEHV
jgi:hypothetical protein